MKPRSVLDVLEHVWNALENATVNAPEQVQRTGAIFHVRRNVVRDVTAVVAGTAAALDGRLEGAMERDVMAAGVVQRTRTGALR